MSLTGKTGKYQNEIDDLKGLGLSRYERIFKVFSEVKEGKEFYFYNLLNKVEFPSNIDSSLLDTYIVQSREPLTTTSFNIYGNIHSWWLLFLSVHIQHLLPLLITRLGSRIVERSVCNL